MIICSQCGNNVEADLRFCSECGNPVGPMAGIPGASSANSPQVSPALTTPDWQPQTQPGYVPPPTRASVPPPRTKPLVWLVIPAGLLVVVFIVVLGIKISNSNSNVSASPAFTGGRLVTCRFNGVHVRDAPNLQALVITDLNKGQAVRVIQESTNRDSVFILSLNQTVSDNWSEVQLEGSSVRGWVFNGFLR